MASYKRKNTRFTAFRKSSGNKKLPNHISTKTTSMNGGDKPVIVRTSNGTQIQYITSKISNYIKSLRRK